MGDLDEPTTERSAGTAGEPPRRPRRSELRAARSGRARARPKTPTPTPAQTPAPTPTPPVEPPAAPTGPTFAPAGSGPSGGAVSGRSRRRVSSGRRDEVVRSRRRRSRLRAVVTVLLVILLVLSLAVIVTELLAPGLLDRARNLVAATPDGSHEVAEGAEHVAAVLVTVDEAQGQAAGVAILAYDGGADQGTVVLVPVGTVTEVPGHGSFTVGEAFAFGSAPLVWVTIDNLLGARLDGAVAVSGAGWNELLTLLGGVDVEVRGQIRDDAGQVRFEPGPQRLDGAAGADYLTVRSEGETELERLPRTRQVLDGVFEAVADDPGLLADLFDDGSPLQAATDPALLRTLLADLADAYARDRVATVTLPVTPLGAGRDDVYRVDTDRIEQLVEDRFAAARPVDGAGTRLQVLNGVGAPGIGQQVAERLRPSGYRVVLTGNADRFTHEETLILVYEETAEQLAAARDIQDLLGVGRIERAPTSQTVVDLTIVVGADFAS